MEHGDHKTLADLLHLPMDLRDLRVWEKHAHRKTPKGNNDTRIDDFNLMLKIIAGTHFNFNRQRVTVPGRAAFDYIGDKYIRAGHARLCKQLIQELPGGAHKRASLFIFTRARSFADEHNFSMSGSFARDCFLPGPI